MRLAPGMFVRGSRGASIVGTSPLPLNIDPVPTIKVDTSLAHSKFVQQHRFYEKMGTKAHPDCLRGSSPRSHLFAARSAQHWEWFGSGCRFNVSSGCLGK